MEICRVTAFVRVLQSRGKKREIEMAVFLSCVPNFLIRFSVSDVCIFADEKGRLFDKPKLIADITPLPAGYSGTIKVENAQSRIIGNTAILSYDADEPETIFGQNLKARYHITDTWLQRNGNWQIIASQAHRYYEDPAVGKADP